MDCISLKNIPDASGFSEYFRKYIHDSRVDICISYESDFKNAKILREVVDYLCITFGVSPKWRTRFVLISDELNNNAIEYGSNIHDINTFYISITRYEKNTIKICFSVKDSGLGEYAKTSAQMLEIKQKYAQKDFTHHDSIRGRGLFLIISQLVDSINFQDAYPQGLMVEVEKTLQASQ